MANAAERRREKMCPSAACHEPGDGPGGTLVGNATAAVALLLPEPASARVDGRQTLGLPFKRTLRLEFSAGYPIHFRGESTKIPVHMSALLLVGASWIMTRAGGAQDQLSTPPEQDRQKRRQIYARRARSGSLAYVVPWPDESSNCTQTVRSCHFSSELDGPGAGGGGG